MANRHTNSLKPLLLAMALTTSMGASADLYEDARQYQERGETRAAVIQLKNLLQESPDHLRGRQLLGELMMNERQYGAAEKELGRALELGADKMSVLPLLIRSQLQQGKAAAARETLEQHWDEQQEPSQRWQLLGRILTAEKRFTEAENAFYQSLKFGRNPRSTLGLALVARLRGSMNEALGILEPIIEEPDVQQDALALKTDILLDLNRAQEAMEGIDRLIKQSPDNPKFRLARARALLMLNQIDAAKRDLDALPEAYQQTPPAQLLKAMVALGEHQYDTAYQHANTILQQFPDSPRALLVGGTALYSGQKYELALKHLREYVALIPRDPNGRRLLAATQQSLNQSTAALKTLEPLLTQPQIDPRAAAIAGYAHISLGEWEEGEKLLSQALEKEPKLSELQNRLIFSQIMTGQSDSALATIEAGGKTNLQTDTLQVMAYLQQQDYPEARSFIGQRRQQHPQQPAYLMLQALIDLRQQEIGAAKQSYRQALEIDSEYIPALLALGRLELQAQQPDKAEQHYRRVLQIDNNHLTAMMGLALIAEQRQDIEGSLEWINRAREAHPDAIQPLTALVRHYNRQGLLDKARKEAYSFHVNHPQMADATLLYISILTASDKLDEAEKQINQLLKLYPGRAVIHSTKAKILREMRRRKEALVHSGKALELAPDHPDYLLLHLDLLLLENQVKEAAPLAEKLWGRVKNPISARMLGLVRLGQERYDEAIPLLEKAKVQTSVDQILATALANAYQRQGQLEKAVDILGQRLQEAPDEFTTRFRLAMMHQATGNHKAAIEQYEYLRNRHPKNPAVWNNLAWLYQQEQDPRSLDHAREAYRLAPQRPDIKDTLGWILLSHNYPEEAEKLLREAARALPRVEEVQYHYATALVKTGKPALATDILKPLSQREGPFQAPAKELLKQIGVR